jgi:DNA-binding MarR family transcriptional regulator
MDRSVTSPIIGLVIDLLDAVLYVDKKQIVEAREVRLHPSESHVLVCAVQGMTFTEIAQRFGISKGAVSQTFSRLAAKEVVVVNKDRLRKNAARVTLTSLGEALYAQVKTVRSHLSEDLESYLAEYSAEELAAVERFVGDLLAFTNESLAGLPTPGGHPR